MGSTRTVKGPSAASELTFVTTAVQFPLSLLAGVTVAACPANVTCTRDLMRIGSVLCIFSVTVSSKVAHVGFAPFALLDDRLIRRKEGSVVSMTTAEPSVLLVIAVPALPVRSVKAISSVPLAPTVHPLSASTTL